MLKAQGAVSRLQASAAARGVAKLQLPHRKAHRTLVCTCDAENEDTLDERSQAGMVSHTLTGAAQQGGSLSSRSHTRERTHTLITFYRLAEIANPDEVVLAHRKLCKRLGIKGRIYISSQGINAQFSGEGDAAMQYTQLVLTDPRFTNTRVSVSHIQGHAFPRLRVKNKELVQQADWWRVNAARDGAGGKRLSPHAWKAVLDRLHNAAADVHAQGDTQSLPQQPQQSSWTKTAAFNASSICSECNSAAPEEAPDLVERDPLLLDVRNSYEWDAGAFEGSVRPEGVDSFRYMLDQQVSTGGALDVSSADAKERPVMMYCTGGIRCEFYSEALKQQGFKEVYQLDGGIERYLREVGNNHWNGALFTFDDRLALAPDGKTPAIEADDPDVQQLQCFCCFEYKAQAPHRNCANPDCNRLYLCCNECAEALAGACCPECMQVENKRPYVPLGEPFTKLVNYTDESTVHARRGKGRGHRRKRYRAKRAASDFDSDSEGADMDSDEDQSVRKALQHAP